MTYHVGPNGKPSICKAKQGNCPYENISPHFDTVEKAQLYSDNLNAFIAKNVTTETELSKHCKINEIIESQNMEVRLRNIKQKEENILKQATETVWDYTDASILVTFQKIGNRSVTTNQLNKKLKILQTKNI